MSQWKPWFVLVGGINGAGKSTFSQAPASFQGLELKLGRNFEVINPDIVTRKHMENDQSLRLQDANILAANACEQRVLDLIEQRDKSFAIETVLSTDKYKAIVHRALANGYRVQFVYMLLGSIDEAIARVKLRVSRGGHDVPVDKIRSRWGRSLANLPWFCEHATQSLVFFNGSRVPEPILVSARHGRRVMFNPEAITLLLPDGAPTAR